MKHFFVIAFFLLSVCFANAQQTKEWIDKLENADFFLNVLTKENHKSKYLKHDFSTLFVPRDEFLGYIGDNYRRIRIFYHSIVKDSVQSDIYHVKGVSVVSKNKCDFSGTIKIDQIREYKEMHYGVDLKFKDEGFQAQGLVLGRYEFKENPSQYHSGVFEGIVTMYWYMDRFGEVHYDKISWYSDNYCNNQYVGVWKSYTSGNKKVCNWGERRIPFDGDLDIGAGCFSPNKKYYHMGWDDPKLVY